MTLRWGLLSTANINRALLDSGHGGIVAVGVALGRARRGVRARARHRARPRLLRGAARGPRGRRVYNPLPNSMHVEWSIRALEAGKHVLCEKPLSRHPADVDRAFDVAEREGLVLAEAFMYRHNPQIARARQLVADGAIGPLRVIRALLLLRPPATRTTSACFADLEGGGADGRRLLLRQRRAHPRGRRARARLRRAGRSAARASTSRLAGDAALPRRRARARSTAGCPTPPATSSRRRRGRLGVPRRPVARPRHRSIELRRPARRPSASRCRGRTPYALELEDFEAAVARRARRRSSAARTRSARPARSRRSTAR